jgi:hypothetical protein
MSVWQCYKYSLVRCQCDSVISTVWW